MSLSEEERTTLVRFQFEKARNTMHEAEALISSNFWNGAANRLYYSIFHAVSALLIHDKHQVNTHQGSHALFGLHYIKTGKIPAEYGRLYSQLQTIRDESDYNCLYDVNPDDLKEKLEPAKQLLDIIETMI